jgi:hypothetical protein
MTAILIGTTDGGLELRLATSPLAVWPGYHESAPLGCAGYWLGTHRKHDYLGTDETAARAELAYWGG